MTKEWKCVVMGRSRVKDLMEYDEARLKKVEEEYGDVGAAKRNMEINQLTQDGWIVEKIVVGGLNNSHQYIWLSRERKD